MSATSDTPRPLPTLPGEKFANVRYHAEGGMSWVYLAYNLKLERDEIIKLLKPGKSPAQRREFEREGRTLARFSHQNICQVFDVDKCPEGPFVNMEYIQGPTLEEWRNGNRQGDQPAPTLREILRIFSDLAKALDFAHSQKVIHSDLKPENVLLSFDEVSRKWIPKLIDFGIARRIDSETDLQGDLQKRIAGTLPYMAPEQLRGDGVSASSDLYSLGVMFYELLTGRLPFDGDQETIYKGHQSGAVPRLPKHLIRLQPVVERAMAKSPSVRFRNCESFVSRAVEAANQNPELKALLDTPPMDPDAPRVVPEMPERGRTQTHTHSFPVQETRLADVRRLVGELRAIEGSIATNPKSFELMRQLAELKSGLQTKADANLVREAIEGAQAALSGRLDLSGIAAELIPQIARAEGLEAFQLAKQAALRGKWLPPDEDNALDHVRFALERVPDLADARQWLEQLPQEIDRAAGELLRSRQVEQALALLRSAAKEFPDLPLFAERVSMLEARMRLESERKARDQAAGALAKKLKASPPAHAIEAIRLLRETADESSPGPGQRALQDELSGWFQSLAAQRDFDVLAMVRKLLDKEWETLPSLVGLADAARALQSRWEQAQSARENQRLLAELGSAVDSKDLLGAGQSRLFELVRQCLDLGLRAEVDKLLRDRAGRMAAQFSEAVWQQEAAPAAIESWLAAAVESGLPSGLLDGLRKRAKQALEEKVLVRAFVDAAEFVSTNRRPPSDLATTLAKWSRVGDRPSSQLADARQKLLAQLEASVAEVVEGDAFEEFGRVAEWLRATFGNSDREASKCSKALQAALDQYKQRRAALALAQELDSALASLLADASPERVVRFASLLRTLAKGEDRSGWQDRALAAVNTRLGTLAGSGDWKGVAGLIEAAKDIAPAAWLQEWRGRIPSEEETAETFVDPGRARDFRAEILATLEPEALLNRPAALIEALDEAVAAGEGAQASELLRDREAVLATHVRKALGSGAVGRRSVAGWLDQLSTREVASAVAPRLVEIVRRHDRVENALKELRSAKSRLGSGTELIATVESARAALGVLDADAVLSDQGSQPVVEALWGALAKAVKRAAGAEREALRGLHALLLEITKSIDGYASAAEAATAAFALGGDGNKGGVAADGADVGTSDEVPPIAEPPPVPEPPTSPPKREPPREPKSPVLKYAMVAVAIAAVVGVTAFVLKPSPEQVPTVDAPVREPGASPAEAAITAATMALQKEPFDEQALGDASRAIEEARRLAPGDPTLAALETLLNANAKAAIEAAIAEDPKTATQFLELAQRTPGVSIDVAALRKMIRDREQASTPASLTINAIPFATIVSVVRRDDGSRVQVPANASTPFVASGLKPGAYRVTVRDSKGATQTADVTVNPGQSAEIVAANARLTRDEYLREHGW